MVRIEQIKQKLHPNEKLRAWAASHTFGGTTKTKSLYILGFRRKNFYYVAGAVGGLILIAAIAGGLGFQSSIKNTKAASFEAGGGGGDVVSQIVESRTRLVTSGGKTFLTTEVTAFSTTSQRGGGKTSVKITGADGKPTTVAGLLTVVTDSKGGRKTKTLLGSPLVTTGAGGSVISTTIFGDAVTTTDQSGKPVTNTVYDGLTVVTGEDGKTSTGLREPTAAKTSGKSSGKSSAKTSGKTAGGDKTTGTSPTEATPTGPGDASTTDGGGEEKTSAAEESSSPTNEETSAAETSAATSSAKASTSTASSSAAPAGGGGDSGGDDGGDGEKFVGEATFYAPGLGSCGTDATDDDFVAALSKVLFDATGATNSNNNPYCGRKALVKPYKGSKKRAVFLDGITTRDNDDDGRIWFTLNVTRTSGTLQDERDKRGSRRSKASDQREYHSVPEPESVDDNNNSKKITQIPQNPTKIAAAVGALITPPPSSKTSLLLQKKQEGGGGVTITVVDRCPVCKQYDLDLSPAAYNLLGDPDAGRIKIEWSWLD